MKELKAGLKASENSGTKDTNSADESPANKPPPLAVQLAIVNSLLIMFEIPLTHKQKVDRAIKMNESTEAIEGLKEEVMTAAIDYMERICGDEVFSAAVYEYMRMYFCKSNDDYISDLNTADTVAKTAWKDFKSLELDDQIVCNGITANAG